PIAVAVTAAGTRQLTPGQESSRVPWEACCPLRVAGTLTRKSSEPVGLLNGVVRPFRALPPPVRLDGDAVPEDTAVASVWGALLMQVVCSNCQYSGELAPSDTGAVVCPGCGSSIRSESGTTAGWTPSNEQRRFGRFELREAVGTGAFGTVYEARDTELDRIVAIKVPRSDRLTGMPGE